MLYPVSEIFYSIQGEGFHTGRPAVFIRLSGCNLKCPWCDTDHSKHQMVDDKDITGIIKSLLLGKYDDNILIVITGGEPTLYDLFPLCQALQEKFYYNIIAVETNGYNLRNIPHKVWKTISPKILMQNCEIFFERKEWAGNELKVVFEPGIDTKLLKQLPKRLKKRFEHFYIQPCSGDFQPAVDFVKGNPKWKLSVQIQKIINIS